MNRGRRLIYVLSGVCVAAIFTTLLTTNITPRVVYNPSPSAPIGFYWVSNHHQLTRGDYVLVKVPDSVKNMAIDRGYIGPNTPLLKQVFAITGDHVCTRYGTVYVNLQAVAEAKNHDPSGRKIPIWDGCRELQTGEYFLLNVQSDHAFDSRYFGPVQHGQVIGKAFPIWVWAF